jgi:hypothetical protein
MQVSVLVGTGTFSGLIAKPDSAAADRVPLPLKSSESDDAMSGSSSKRSPSAPSDWAHPLPLLRWDWARSNHVCARIRLRPATRAL